MKRFLIGLIVCLAAASAAPTAHAQSEYLRSGEHAFTATDSYSFASYANGGAYTSAFGYALSSSHGIAFDGSVAYSHMLRLAPFRDPADALIFSAGVGYLSANATPFTVKATVAHERGKQSGRGTSPWTSWTFTASAAPTIQIARTTTLVPRIGFLLMRRSGNHPLRRRDLVLEPGATFSMGLVVPTTGGVRVVVEPSLAYNRSTQFVFSGTLGLLVRVKG